MHFLSFASSPWYLEELSFVQIIRVWQRGGERLADPNACLLRMKFLVVVFESMTWEDLVSKGEDTSWQIVKKESKVKSTHIPFLDPLISKSDWELVVPHPSQPHRFST